MPGLHGRLHHVFFREVCMHQRVRPVEKASGRPRILVIDDEPEMCRCLERCLGLLECTSESCTSGIEGLARLEKRTFDLVFTDLRMPGMNGVEVVKAVKRLAAGTSTIVLTGYGTIGSAVEAMHAGANDYLTPPFKIDELRAAIEKALAPQRTGGGDSPGGDLIGHSHAIKKLRAQIEQVAAVASTALIFGETGVGKEVVAKAIHSHSDRRMRAFVAVNCGAIQENLLESELFGYERGAFTGAVEMRRGRVESANHGTLFLDEIAETSLSFQTALLRVLQEKEISRIGGNEPIKVDFRLIAATNKNLQQHVKEGKFREDLYYRLNVVSLTVSPLREHREDIPLLVEHFTRKHRAKVNKEVAGVSPETMMLLTNYSWPGNIRQLENAIEKAMVLTANTIIQASDLPAEVTSGDAEIAPGDCLHAPMREAKDTFEKSYIETILREAGGNVSEAARQARIARPYLHERIRKYEINPEQYRMM